MGSAKHDRHKPLESATLSNSTQIYDGKKHNIICKILDIYDWKKSRGDDYVMTLAVTDNYKKRFFLKIFNDEPRKMNFTIKDKIFVRAIKWFKEDLFYVQQPVNIEILKQDIFCDHKRKTIKVEDICSTNYVEIAGFVIHKQKESTNIVLLYLVDYTSNKSVGNHLNRGKFTNDMVLHVKLWDDQCAIYDDIILNQPYKLENLKVEISNDLLFGNLSNTEGSKIYQLHDENEILELVTRRNAYNARSKEFYNEIYEPISNITEEGYFKSQFKILKHFPENGCEIVACKHCNYTSLVQTPPCECHEDNKTTIRILKLLIEEQNGDKKVLICKDEVCDIALNLLSIHCLSWECLIYAHTTQEGFVFEIKDFIS